MPFRTSRARHRFEFAAAVLVTVGAVYGLSRLSRLSCIGKAASPEVAPFVQAPPIVPRVDPPLGRAVTETTPSPSLPAPFVDAVTAGSVERMKAFYIDGMNLAERHARAPEHLLSLAAASGHADAVVWLLDHGVNVHESEAESDAPLLLADAHPAVSAVLLARGAAEPNLTLAALAGAASAVKRQLAAGANPNVGDGLEAPLSAALERASDAGASDARDVRAVTLLAAAGAKVTGENLVAALALPKDVRDGVVDSLLGGRLEPDATSFAFTRAEGERDASVIGKIARHGVAWVSHDGESDVRAPLLDAIDRLDVALVRAFLQAGAPADVRLKDGRSPLGAAIEHAGVGARAVESDGLDAAQVVELLLTHGANPNRRLADGNTPLIAAAAASGTQARLVRALLDHGARVNEVVLDATALDEAERTGNLDAARVLEARGGRRAWQ